MHAAACRLQVGMESASLCIGKHILATCCLQAKECLGLLPDSPAAQDQLASIRAAEQLQRVGLDLPPLQLQQLQARAAAGDGRVLEQVRRRATGRALAKFLGCRLMLAATRVCCGLRM